MSGLCGGWLLSLLASLAHGGSRSADFAPPAGHMVSDLEAYRAARARFAERMEEIEQDTLQLVSVSERAARSQLDRRYEGVLGELESTGQAQRELAIGRFEDFLAKYPDIRYADHVRFRLAELWYEKATDEWLAASAAAEAADVAEPKRDLSRPLALYREIVDQNRARPDSDRYERLDGAYLMLAFVYMDPNAEQYDERAAQHAFLDLIGEVPRSDLADRAHLYLGNFAFDRNEYDAAMAEYKLVVDKGEGGKYFEEALYQLAWAKYKRNVYDEALALFSRLLDRSEALRIAKEKESAFAPDARRFMAFSIAELTDPTRQPEGETAETTALEFAKRYFGSRQPAYERDVYEQLADVLVRYVRLREAVEVYEFLQTDPLWVDHPNNPSLQIAKINLFLNSVIRDLEAAGQGRVDFIERYGEGTAWWLANRDDPDVLDVARRFVESSLLEVAVEYRISAEKSGDTAAYALAASKYREYLQRFPISDDYYEQQWFLADSLTRAQDWAAARTEYESLARSAAYHPFGDASVYALMDVEYQALHAAGHRPDVRPTDAEVERSYTVGDRTIEVYRLSPDREAFIAAADRVLAHPFRPPTDVAEVDVELPDYAAAIEQRRPAIEYLIGQILFHHHRYDEARERFSRVVDLYPRSVDAKNAAGLLVDSYLAEGNLEQVRLYTKRFTLQPPGPTWDADTKRFEGTLEGATFQLAVNEAEHGDPLAAADQFLAFGTEFPDSPLAADALYNAAFYTQQVGRAERANELYEQFVSRYPGDERAKGLFFRIAANYESTFDLERAIAYYDKVLLHRSASAAEKADAQYNRSFLMIGLGRHLEAAQGFEGYEARYPEQADREKILFLAGEQWERVGQAEAMAFYERYRKRYPNADPDHVIEAGYKLTELYVATGQEGWRVRRMRAAVLADFDRFEKAGKPIGPKGHEYAAQTALLELESEYQKLGQRKLTGNDARDVKILDQAQSDLLAFEAKVKVFVSKYRHFDSNARALLLQGQATLAYADLGLSIQCPATMSEEDCWLFEDVLQEEVFPKFYAIEEVGLKRLQELIGAAETQKRYAPAIASAAAELNRRRPGEFPAVKQEIEGRPRPTSGVEPEPRRFPVADGRTP